MNELILKASEIQEATGLSGPALLFLAALATAAVLGGAYLYVRNRRRGRM